MAIACGATAQVGGPLRIALVADGDPRNPRTNSGVALGLLTALDRRQDLRVVCAVDSTPPKLIRMPVVALSWRPKYVHWKNQARKGGLATAVRSWTRNWRLRRTRVPYDIVLHVRNAYLPTRHSPYVAFLDGTTSLSQRYWESWALGAGDYRRRTATEARYFSGAILVATAGAHVAEELRRVYDQPRSKVVAIGGGTNVVPQPQSPRRSDGRVNFLFVGAAFERKGGQELLAAFQSLHSQRPNTSLTIAGPIGVSAAQSGVECLGFISDREQIQSLYQRADVFCLPSRYEPYGLVVQEALAYGLPCIVSDRGALSEIVGNAGVTVEAESVKSLFNAMLRLVDDAELRAAMSQAAPLQLQGRSWDDVAGRLVVAIKRALSDESP